MRAKLLILLVLVGLVAVPVIAGTAAAGPGPGLTFTGATQAATGSVATFQASYRSGANKPIPGAQIAFKLANQPAVTAVTNAKGVAVAKQEILKAAGTYFLTVSATGGPTTTIRYAVKPPGTDASIVTVSNGGGEPSVISAPGGDLFLSSPAGPILARSADRGNTWTALSDVPFTSSGDTSINADASGAVYLSNLNGDLQGDVYKSTANGNGPWVHGDSPALASSSQPLLVDRQWTDAYIPPGDDHRPGPCLSHVPRLGAQPDLGQRLDRRRPHLRSSHGRDRRLPAGPGGQLL